MKRPIALVCLLAATAAVRLAGQNAVPAACEDDPLFAQMDFWVGEWDVVDEAGNPQGTNRIEKVLARCAVLEHWTGADGFRGMSLFYVDPGDRVWKQVWVTERATTPGGLKEKALIERLEGGGVRFQGRLTTSDGRTWLDRTTLTPNRDGTVRQHIQQSTDDGESWNEGWIGVYRPRG